MDKYLSHFEIAEQWATPESRRADIDRYKEKIEQAVINYELEAVIEERVKGFDDGFKEIADKNRIRKIKDGWLNGTFTQYTIHRDNFLAWLKATNQYPSWDGCQLNLWFKGDEPQSKAVGDDGKEKTGYQARDDDFKEWIVDVRPDLKSMTWGEIHTALLARNPRLWTSGFTDWKKNQDIHKGKPGRKPNQ